MIRLIVFGFLFLSVAYLLVSLYSRSVRREKLEKHWDAEVKEGDRDAYIETGMQKYEAGFRKKLIALIFIIPVCVVAAIIYIMNYT